MSIAYSLLKFARDVHFETGAKSLPLELPAKAWEALVADLSTSRVADGRYEVHSGGHALVIRQPDIEMAVAVQRGPE